MGSDGFDAGRRVLQRLPSAPPCARSRPASTACSCSSRPCTATTAASSSRPSAPTRGPSSASTSSSCRTTTRARAAAPCAACTSRPPGPGQARALRARRDPRRASSTSGRGSPTFGSWEGLELDDDDLRQLYVPVGFAHGFCVTSRRGRRRLQVLELLRPGHRGGHRPQPHARPSTQRGRDARGAHLPPRLALARLRSAAPLSRFRSASRCSPALPEPEATAPLPRRSR